MQVQIPDNLPSRVSCIHLHNRGAVVKGVDRAILLHFGPDSGIDLAEFAPQAGASAEFAVLPEISTASG